MRVTTIKELKRVLPLHLEVEEMPPGLVNLYAGKEAWTRGEMGFFQRLRLAFSIIKGPPVSFESLGLDPSIQEHKGFLKGLAYAAKLAKKLRDRDRSADPAVNHGISIVADELDAVYDRKKGQHEASKGGGDE